MAKVKKYNGNIFVELDNNLSRPALSNVIRTFATLVWIVVYGQDGKDMLINFS